MVRQSNFYFAQQQSEPFYAAWDRFNGLVESCRPNLTNELLTISFYNGLNDYTRSWLEDGAIAATGALLLRRSHEARMFLLNDMADFDFHWHCDPSLQGWSHQYPPYPTSFNPSYQRFESQEDHYKNEEVSPSLERTLQLFIEESVKVQAANNQRFESLEASIERIITQMGQVAEEMKFRNSLKLTIQPEQTHAITVLHGDTLGDESKGERDKLKLLFDDEEEDMFVSISQELANFDLLNESTLSSIENATLKEASRCSEEVDELERMLNVNIQVEPKIPEFCLEGDELQHLFEEEEGYIIPSTEDPYFCDKYPLPTCSLFEILRFFSKLFIPKARVVEAASYFYYYSAKLESFYSQNPYIMSYDTYYGRKPLFDKIKSNLAN